MFSPLGKRYERWREIELVEENGKMIPKNQHRNFKQGYKKGLETFKLRLSTTQKVDQSDIHKSR